MKKKDRTILWLFAAAIIVSLSWLFWFTIVLSTSSFQWIELDKYGQFGDSFNVLGVLFNGLALSFLVWTAVMQRKELSETKAALEKQANIQDTQLRLSKLPWIQKNTMQSKPNDHFLKLQFTLAPALKISQLILTNDKGRRTSMDPETNSINEGELTFYSKSSNSLKPFKKGQFTFLDIMSNQYEITFQINNYTFVKDTYHFDLEIDPPKLIEKF